MIARHAVIALLSLCMPVLGCARSTPEGAAAERLRDLERQRLRSLVDADTATAARLHSDAFQLVNPAGAALTKQEYLGALASGQLDYVAWEPGEIAVRVYDDAAVIRYRDARFEVSFPPNGRHDGPMYHTNVYERRAGEWQIVWSQASGVISP